jgi:hypothetical protein
MATTLPKKTITFTKAELQTKVLNIDNTAAKMYDGHLDKMIEYNIREAFRRALNGVFPDEQPNPQAGTKGIEFEKRVERANLSSRIYNTDKDVEISPEEFTELKLCIGKFFKEPEPCLFINNILTGKKAS